MYEEINEKGIVNKINGSTVEVLMNSSEECEECTAKLFCKPTSNEKNLLSITSNDKFQIGDLVEVAVKGKTVLLFTFFLYGIPLIMLIAILLVGLYFLRGIANNEFYSFAISMFLITVYYFLFNKFIKENVNFFNTPTIIKTDN